MTTKAKHLIPILLAVLFINLPARAQLPESLLGNLKPRAVGPAAMGGRTVDFAVFESDPAIFYAASASGGLLKTINAGNTWENVFDSQGSVSIGDVAIHPRDYNVIWVGTGEANNRQSSSWGDGIYKSTDGGRTWKYMGLRESRHIGRIVVDPVDSDIVYVAALGRLWGPNRERGVYKTTDGGLNWQQVLTINEDAGACDIAMDPANPKTLYAAAYQRRRSPWGFNGGGPHGGIYKTVDGGRTWRKLTQGLPTGDTGRIGLDIYRGNPDIVYAIIENEKGGVFRSDDKGESWTRLNALNPRPMYYSQIRVDPTDEKRIYVLGTQLHVSDDGGKTFRDDGAPGVHLDHHALWIDPHNPRHLIDGNDGGIWVSRDRSASWEHLNNYPIGQFYHVSVDMQQPYWIYGGMQDNATWGGPSAVRDRVGIRNQDWIQMLACDGMYAVPDPTDHNTIYTNCQNGRIVRYDRATGERQAVMPQPSGDEASLRWNWTTPIVISPHDAKTLYTGANRVYKSADRGHTWTAVSPDLTTQTDRDELTLMGVAGKDIKLSKNDGMSSFGNITALAESPIRSGLIYAGTDDGNVHVTRNGGQNWENLTSRISGVPSKIYVSRLTPSAFDEGLVYLSFDGHRSDDFKPYVLMSADYGQTWRSLTANLPEGSVYTIKEDPKNRNLLYVGTEFGLFVSMNRNSGWTRWNSIPTVAVYDLVIHPRDNDLVLATHGRSFLVVDDISPFQQLSENILGSASHLFDMRPATQFIPNESAWFIGGREFTAPNPPLGAYINYYLGSPLKDPAKITITDSSGKTVRELEGPKEAGLHRVVWDLRTAPVAPSEPGFYGNVDFTNAGPFVLPGEYMVKFSAGTELTKPVRVLGDPQAKISDSDRKQRLEVLMTVTGMQSAANSAETALNKLKEQLDEITERLKSYPKAPESVKAAMDKATKEVNDLRTQLLGSRDARREGGGDNPPLQRRINGLKTELVGSQSLPTTIQSTRQREYLKELNDLVARVNSTLQTTMPDLYKLLTANGIWPKLGDPIKPVTP